MLDHVDDFLPAHNVDSLTGLADALARPHQAPFSSFSTARVACQA
jgi:hypothetical protein